MKEAVKNNTGSDLDCLGAPFRVFMTDLRCGHFFFVEMKNEILRVNNENSI